MPDELVRSILEQAVDNWLPCKDWSTFRSLLLLRRVNKTFRDYVDRGAYAFFCKMEDAVRAALKTKTPEDLVEARNILLRDNMCVFSVLAEVGRLHELAIGPSIYCLMRLRSGKKPEEMPPPTTRGRLRGGGGSAGGRILAPCPRRLSPAAGEAAAYHGGDVGVVERVTAGCVVDQRNERAREE